jgi:hypothetical protein
LKYPATVCLPCPDETTCYGGNIIELSVGRWRPNVTTDEIIQCPLSESCLGGYDVKCREGY